MWYVADLLFAQRPTEGRPFVCETCLVLLNAESARKAYDKAMQWGEDHVQGETGFEFVGIQHLYSLEEERPADGSEIGGHFFESEDIWEKRVELIPEIDDIPIIRFEDNPKTPIGELVSEETKRLGRRFL